MVFKQNMGKLDQTARVTIGLILLTLGPFTNYILSDTLSNTLFGLMGSLALLSALCKYCFLYELTGFSTIKKAPAEPS